MNDSRFAHRKSPAKLCVTLPDGTPLLNEEVSVSQTHGEVLFGCGAFDAVELAGGNADGSPIDAGRRALLEERLDKICALFDYGTLPFYLANYERVKGKTDARRLRAAAQYLVDRGVTPKGHPLCWHSVCAPWLMKYDRLDVLSILRNRVYRDVSEFKGLIDVWDVINEVVIMPLFDKYDNAVTPLCKAIGRVRLIRDLFHEAKWANPGALLILNDFNTSIEYEILIDGCLQSDVPIGAIGIQSHQHQGYWGREKLEEVLERFSLFGLPIHFTENTIISGDLMPPHITDLNDWQVDDWPTTVECEARQAQEMVEMYETLFAHPLVGAITTWDPDDGKWLLAPSGILRKDNSEKPVYAALMQKIKHDWRTTTTVNTDAQGMAQFTGFRGDYTVKARGLEASFTLTRKRDIIKLKLEKAKI
jgi:GH35 family endo-1,4-beta-xylanase